MQDTIRVLICHPSAWKRTSLTAALATGGHFEVVGEATNSHEAVAVALELSPNVILLDLEMPPAGGVAVTREIRGHLPNTRLLALLAAEDAETVIRVIAAGASGYVVNRSSPDELCQAIAKIVATPYLDTRLMPTALDSAVHLYRMERELSLGIVGAMAAAIEARDGITSEHVYRVAQLTRALTKQVAPRLLQHPHADYGPLLHDVGKLAISDAILLKPGPLDEQERTEMRQHVEIGMRILQPIPGFDSVRELVHCHHEHWDGGGYPRGLRGNQIPLSSRLFAVCDAYDAMSSDRPYRPSLGEAAALAEIEVQAGHQFDPNIAEEFVELARSEFLEAGLKASPVDTLMQVLVAKRQARIPREGPVRVLVVDDDPIVRAWVRDAFQGSEFSVDGEADTAGEAETLCREREADVILINQRLDGGLGTDLLRTLRQLEPLAPALITSAIQVQGLNETAREAGAQGALHVSAQPEKLLNALREIVADREFLDPEHPPRAAGQRNLSPRERRALQLVASGQSNREIAETLGVSLETVKTMLDRIRLKLGVHRRAEAVVEARKLAMIA